MSIVKEEFYFPSSNGTNVITGFKIFDDGRRCKAVVQISHGMVEHIDRYEDFMRYLAGRGYAVYAHNHLGHKGSVHNDRQLGYFAPENGYKYVLADLLHTAKMAKKENPGKKLFLLGHSMGSFFARVFAAAYPDALDGLIISGTGGENKIAPLGLKLIQTAKTVHGGEYRSGFINKTVFGNFLSKIENPRTNSDWISRDEGIVNRYVNDKYCQFVFTLSAFEDLMKINMLANKKVTFSKTAKDLPIFIFSGSMDPVGDYGRGVMQVFDRYVTAGCDEVKVKIYPGGRHEMLNETNRRQVYEDIALWLDEKTEERR